MIHKSLEKGDYVLATKWYDGDPGDAWAIGFYDCELRGRHYVLNGAGEQIRHNGYRAAGCITREVGEWLINVAAKQLEQSPPGTVNLWKMLTEDAFIHSGEISR